MIARVALVATLSACTFSPVPANIDGPVDVPTEVLGEDPPSARFRDNLIGFWTFDEQTGSLTATDSAPTADRVDITALDDARFDPPVFAGGRATTAVETFMQSAKNTHLTTDCVNANAVTLEAWVSPLAVNQGDAAEPVFIAGLAKSVSDRDVVLLQAADRWLGRVRTGAPIGTPDLLSTSAVTATWTHLVVVADGTARTLYVNNVAEATTAGGTLSGWDTSVSMYLFEEPQRTRFWTGSIALVALYNRALTAQQVEQNFIAGPDSP